MAQLPSLSAMRSAAVLSYFASASCTLFYYVAKAPQEPGAIFQGFKPLQEYYFFAEGLLREELLERDLHLLFEQMFMSEVGLFLALNWCLSLYCVCALATTAIFLGNLSPRESSRMTERLVKYTVLKLVFAGAVLSPDLTEVAVWLVWFAAVGYMRIFLGASKDRLESLVVSPVASRSQHVRAVLLLLIVIAHDVLATQWMLYLLPTPTTTKILLCAFDAAIIAIDGLKTLLRYTIHMLDRRAREAELAAPPAPAAGAGAGAGAAGGSGGEGWEGKGAVLYHVELVADVLVHAMTLAHYLHVWFLHGLSFHLIDAILFLDIRAVGVSLHKRVAGYITYRTATYRLQNAFPDYVPPAGEGVGAGGEGEGGQAGAAAECTICLEPITQGKQLPCGHTFHLSCLRAWLQQTGLSLNTCTCPNCRKPILGSPTAATAGARPPGLPGQRSPLAARLDRTADWLITVVDPYATALVIRVGRLVGALPPRPRPPREGQDESPDPPGGGASVYGGGGEGGHEHGGDGAYDASARRRRRQQQQRQQRAQRQGRAARSAQQAAAAAAAAAAWAPAHSDGDRFYSDEGDEHQHQEQGREQERGRNSAEAQMYGGQGSGGVVDGADDSEEWDMGDWVIGGVLYAGREQHQEQDNLGGDPGADDCEDQFYEDEDYDEDDGAQPGWIDPRVAHLVDEADAAAAGAGAGAARPSGSQRSGGTAAGAATLSGRSGSRGTASGRAQQQQQEEEVGGGGGGAVGGHDGAGPSGYGGGGGLLRTIHEDGAPPHSLSPLMGGGAGGRGGGASRLRRGHPLQGARDGADGLLRRRRRRAAAGGVGAVGVSREPPTWSGQAVARGINSIVAAASSLRSSAAHAGHCPGAVAGGWGAAPDEDEGEEVVSSWRPLPTPGDAADADAGGGGGRLGAGVQQQGQRQRRGRGWEGVFGGLLALVLGRGAGRRRAQQR